MNEVELEKKDRVIAEVREQRMNIAKHLGRSEQSLMKVRNRLTDKTRDLHAAQSELVWLMAWAEKRFGIIVGDVVGKDIDRWPNRICEVVARIVESDSKQKQIGWYDPKTQLFCYMTKKEYYPAAYNTYTKSVYVRG